MRGRIGSSLTFGDDVYRYWISKKGVIESVEIK